MNGLASIMSEKFAALIFILLVPAAYFAYKGTFYVTGKQWYEACYELKQAQNKAGWDQAKTDDPYKAALWSQCERLSQKGIYDAGMVMGGNPEADKGSVALGKSCPNRFSEVPIAGTYYLTSDLIAEDGGPSIIDGFIPAEAVVSRVYKQRWPNCADRRKALGFPKIVEKSKGVFDWETPCKRCESDIKK